MSSDWDSVFSKAELEELSDKMDRIVFNNENGFIATMDWTIEQTVQFVWHFYNRMESDVSADFIDEFVSHFAAFLEDYLAEEGIDFREEYQG
jgi:hypothetical protein